VTCARAAMSELDELPSIEQARRVPTRRTPHGNCSVIKLSKTDGPTAQRGRRIMSVLMWIALFRFIGGRPRRV
jgi:hypothetical protein